MPYQGGWQLLHRGREKMQVAGVQSGTFRAHEGHQGDIQHSAQTDLVLTRGVAGLERDFGVWESICILGRPGSGGCRLCER